MAMRMPTRRRPRRQPTRKDSQMRILNFAVAFAFVLVAPSLAGTADTNLPGIGTFAYNGSPVVSSAPQAIMVATR
jgi:hypothetical protein